MLNANAKIMNKNKTQKIVKRCSKNNKPEFLIIQSQLSHKNATYFLALCHHPFDSIDQVTGSIIANFKDN